VSNVYEAFDFSASGFIQLLIRKVHPHRACSARWERSPGDLVWKPGRRFASVAAAASPKQSSISPRRTRSSWRYLN